MRRPSATGVIGTLSVLVLLVVAGVAGSMYWSVLFPSDQMKSLRMLEESLLLPEPKNRVENDRGEYRDDKGVKRFERHISLNFEDSGFLNALRGELTADGWREIEQYPFDEYQYFSFMRGKDAARQCVNGYVKPRDADGIVMHISLISDGGSECDEEAMQDEVDYEPRG